MGKYVKLRSWHIVSGSESRGGQARTLCGRYAALNAPRSDSFGDEKSCESCLRVAAAWR